MDSGDLALQRRVDQPVACERRLLGKARRHDPGHERLATAAFAGGGIACQPISLLNAGRGRAGVDLPDMSWISTCVASSFSLRVALSVASVTMGWSAMAGGWRCVVGVREGGDVGCLFACWSIMSFFANGETAGPPVPIGSPLGRLLSVRSVIRACASVSCRSDEKCACDGVTGDVHTVVL